MSYIPLFYKMLHFIMVFIMQYVLCHIVFIAKEAKHISKYYYVMLINILYFSTVYDI